MFSRKQVWKESSFYMPRLDVILEVVLNVNKSQRKPDLEV